LIGVAIHSYSHEDKTSVRQIPKSKLDQIEEFFISYNKSRGKKFKGARPPRAEAGGGACGAGYQGFRQKEPGLGLPVV
jgi:hypothetical protein